MIMDNEPYEDVYPIGNGDFLASHVSFGGVSMIIFRRLQVACGSSLLRACARYPLWTERILNKAGGQAEPQCKGCNCQAEPSCWL